MCLNKELTIFLECDFHICTTVLSLFLFFLWEFNKLEVKVSKSREFCLLISYFRFLLSLLEFQIRHFRAYFLRIMGNLLWTVYWPVNTSLDGGGDGRTGSICQSLLPWWNSKKRRGGGLERTFYIWLITNCSLKNL